MAEELRNIADGIEIGAVEGVACAVWHGGTMSIEAACTKPQMAHAGAALLKESVEYE